jgi:soluble lytic murein transglycosylase-like protein
MSARLRRIVLSVVVLVASVPAAAQAQIYMWRDSAGNPVLSDTPKDPSAKTFAVSTTGTIRTTRQVPASRSNRFDMLIEEHSTTQGVDQNLVKAVIQAESAYNPSATSVKGAMGLMQLMPATAQQYGVRDPYDPAENIRAGVAYLKSLLTKYSHNVELALAAYNAGPGAVAKYGAVPPYRETKDYVKKITVAVDAAAPPVVRVYRTIEYVEGRPVPRYSTINTPGAALVSTTVVTKKQAP